jgi:hypothetical protein
VRELIVVACHGDDWVGQCKESLQGHVFDADVVYAYAPDRWPTGAFLETVAMSAAFYDRFLLMQDSMTALMDPLPWFRDQWPGSGAVGWQLFPMQWDSHEQQQMVEDRYTSRPSHGICGPVFYTDRESLDRLNELDLTPAVPSNRLESCGSERAWAYAFAQAGMPVVGPDWSPYEHNTTGVGPFRKAWANRP